MITPDSWLTQLIAKLKQAFSDRLIFVGLQGSYRRGEATEKSDIDIVTILDSLSLDDLDIYRNIIISMPESEKACGFLAAKADLVAWPKYDLFTLAQDTKACYGDLESLLPAINSTDIQEGIRITASNLYHLLIHSYLYDKTANYAELLTTLYKSCVFLLQAKYSLHSNKYAPDSQTLLQHLQGNDREILVASLNWKKAEKPGSDKEIKQQLSEIMAFLRQTLYSSGTTKN